MKDKTINTVIAILRSLNNGYEHDRGKGEKSKEKTSIRLILKLGWKVTLMSTISVTIEDMKNKSPVKSQEEKYIGSRRKLCH